MVFTWKKVNIFITIIDQKFYKFIKINLAWFIATYRTEYSREISSKLEISDFLSFSYINTGHTQHSWPKKIESPLITWLIPPSSNTITHLDCQY